MKSQRLVVLLADRQQQVADQFEARPATGHTGCDLQQIRYDAFVHASDPFLRDDASQSVPDAFVLVSHAIHCVDLKSPPQDVSVESQHVSRTQIAGVC